MAKKYKGFTLVELLIVISVIGVLAALMLVGLRMIRARAVDVQRRYDIAALNRMLTSYAAENSEKVPVSAGEAITADTGVGLALMQNGQTSDIPSEPNGTRYQYWSDGSCYLLSTKLAADNKIYSINGGNCSVVNPTTPKIITDIIDKKLVYSDKSIPTWDNFAGLNIAFLNRSTGLVRVVSNQAFDDSGYVYYKFKYKPTSSSNWIEVPVGSNISTDLLIKDFVAQSYDFSLQAFDLFGNASLAANKTVNFNSSDITPPPISPLTTNVSGDNTLVITTNAPAGAESSHVIQQYKPQGGSDNQWVSRNIAFCNFMASLPNPISDNYKLPGGPYDIRSYLVDESGNMSPVTFATATVLGPSSGDYAWPTTSYYGSTKLYPIKDGSQYRFHWEGFGDNVGIDHYHVELKDMITRQVFWSRDYTGLETDPVTIDHSINYWLTVEAYDKAGNHSTDAFVSGLYRTDYNWP